MLAKVDHEVVFIDDSDDGSGSAIASAAITNPCIELVHREGAARAGGLSTAVVQGIRAARGTFVCIMDADLQHPRN